MGSLKEEMRGFREDHKACEKAEDGDHPGSSDGSTEPGLPQHITSQELTSQDDCETGLPTSAKNPISKELSQSVCDSADQSDTTGVEDPAQTISIPVIQHPEAATQNEETVSDRVLSEVDGEIRGATLTDKSMDRDKGREVENKNISVSVPPTPGPVDPRSPAPDGQCHMRTQVSLEVVQCHSAATSPMTPPQGAHSFFFPSSAGTSVGSDTKDAELQVGRLVELCSVATSPMTPKTPFTTAFPELIGSEMTQREERAKMSEGQKNGGHQGCSPVTETPGEAAAEITGCDMESTCTTSKKPSGDFNSKASPESSTGCPASGLIHSQVTLEDSNQHCKQQRVGSMDQDITITVTHYNNEEDDEGESSFYRTEPDMVKIDEYEPLEETVSHVKEEDGEENISTETVTPALTRVTSNTNPPQNQTEEGSTFGEADTDVRSEHSEGKESKRKTEELTDGSATKPPVPESPAPFGCHNIRTQVSLEVVQCQSAATSPMTPPEGDQAFCFPSSFGKCAAVGTETKDVELQVGQQVEFRSVATAPMTPRTPTATCFPEINKGASIEEKIVEEEEGKEEQVDKEEEKVAEEKKVAAAEEDSKEARNCKEKCEEPVQEVSWDEKGMTWEVYGAVVEVTVLGSAIQKHLEKQVKKRQPCMPPPPPLNPSAMPLSAESLQGGSGKGRAGKRREGDGEVSRRRRNPFRLMMENMQQPHCCSKAHTTE